MTLVNIMYNYEKGNYYVYILTNKSNKILYIGVTNDLERRVEEHKRKIVKGFTAKYDLNKLVYYEFFNNIEEAISREKQLTNWHREWKLNLIKKDNPKFKEITA